METRSISGDSTSPAKDIGYSKIHERVARTLRQFAVAHRESERLRKVLNTRYGFSDKALAALIVANNPKVKTLGVSPFNDAVESIGAATYRAKQVMLERLFKKYGVSIMGASKINLLPQFLSASLRVGRTLQMHAGSLGFRKLSFTVTSERSRAGRSRAHFLMAGRRTCRISSAIISSTLVELALINFESQVRDEIMHGTPRILRNAATGQIVYELDPQFIGVDDETMVLLGMTSRVSSITGLSVTKKECQSLPSFAIPRPLI